MVIEKRLMLCMVWAVLALVSVGVVFGACTDTDGDGFGVCPNCNISNGCTYDYNDCNDADNSIFPPYVGKTISQDVTFCPGAYTWNVASSPMMPISGVGLTISGDNTKIICNESKYGYNVFYITYQDDTIVQGMTIQDCWGGVETYQSSPSYPDRIEVRNMTFNNSYTALWLQHGNLLNIHNLTFIDSRMHLYCSVSGPGITESNFTDMKFYDSSIVVQGSWSAGNHFSDIDFENPTATALNLWSSPSSTYDNIRVKGELAGFQSADYNNFTNMTGEGYATGYGIDMSGSSNDRFYNVTLFNYTRGVYTYDSRYNNFTKSTFHNNTVGVFLDYHPIYHAFWQNKFYDNSQYHVSYQPGSGYTNNLSIKNAGIDIGNYWDDIASLDITDTNEDGFGDSGTDYPYGDQTSSKVYSNPSYYHIYDFGPRVGPVAHDNVTGGERYWIVDRPSPVRLYTQTTFWNKMSYCSHSIYEPACSTFSTTIDNDTVVLIAGVTNNVSQKYVRYHHNDTDGLDSGISSTEQINIVYGSYIQNSSLWNTTVQNNSDIRHSDVDNSVVDGCKIFYSFLNHVTNLTDDYGNCTLNNTRISYSALNHGTVGDSNITNSSVSDDSDVGDSEINDSKIKGCGIYGSTIRNAIAYEHSAGKCAIRNSVILDSNVKDSTIEDSYIDPSIVTDSTIINSTCNNCNISYSTIIDSDICGPFEIIGATIVDKILTAGKIVAWGQEYFPTVSTDSICSEMPYVNITYPLAGSVVNGSFDITFTSTENLSVEISLDGGEWTIAGSNTSYTLDTSTLEDGVHTVRVRDIDAAGHYVYSTMITITSDNYPDAVIVLRPLDNEVIYGDYSVEAIAAEYVSEVRFSLVNVTGSYALDGSVGYTADGPAGGFAGLWQTGNFGEGTYTLNVSAHTRCYFFWNCYNASTTVENLIIDRTAPTGSIEIIGTHGDTTLSPYSSVVLNMTYSDANGVDKCRFANDAEANLATAIWEPCTTMKSWILTSGEGIRTVWAQIKDASGNSINVSDDITVSWVLDTTPPTDPTVEDGLIPGEDIDWMGNFSVKANWYGSIEDISQVYYKYRVLENGSCMGGCAYIDAGQNTSVEIDGVTLIEGTNYSVSVIAYNSFGVESANVTSNGVITDFTDPGNVSVESSTYPVEGEAYSNSTGIFYFNASDVLSANVMSGIYGYSWELDDWPGTRPDNRIDGRVWKPLAEMPDREGAQLLKIEEDGNAFKVVSEVDENLAVGQKLRVRVAVFETEEDTDQEMNLDVGLVDDACTDFGTCGSWVAFNQSVEDIKYAYAVEGAKIYERVLTVGIDVTDRDFFVVVGGYETDDDNANNLSIVYGDAADTGTTTYLCEEKEASCSENSSRDYGVSVDLLDVINDTYTVVYQLLADDNYYFHVRARDNAGNWGNVTHYNFIVDTGAASLDILEPMDNDYFIGDGSGEANISVKVYSSENVSGWISVDRPSSGNWNSSKEEVDGEWTFENITLETGDNTIYFYGNTSAGVTSRSLPVEVLLGTDAGSESNKSLRVHYTACGNAQSNLCYNAEGGIVIGLASEFGGPGANSYNSVTDYESVKVFATTPFDYAGVNTELSDNEFQDQVNPIFGFNRKAGEYLLRNELRYQDILLGGDFSLAPGKYSLYLRMNGRDADGDYNVSLVIR